jgi:hypothetical protein
MATDSQFELIEIHDMDDDHEVGGQDLPLKVTLRYVGDYRAAEARICASAVLGAFNVQPGERHSAPNHIEFLTFEGRAVFAFLGLQRPLTPREEIANRYWRSVYAKTVGELRAAIADLPDDFPLIHTGTDTERKERYNRLGVRVHVNEWCWHVPERQQYGRADYAMRIDALGSHDWECVVKGTFVNQTKLHD